MFGRGEYGMLGNGSKSSIYSPVQNEFFQNENLKIKDVALGRYHTLALTGNKMKKNNKIQRKENQIFKYFFENFFI